MSKERRKAMVALAVGVLLLIMVAIGLSVITARKGAGPATPVVLPY